jgi:hypothetical protein
MPTDITCGSIQQFLQGWKFSTLGTSRGLNRGTWHVGSIILLSFMLHLIPGYSDLLKICANESFMMSIYQTLSTFVRNIWHTHFRSQFHSYLQVICYYCNDKLYFYFQISGNGWD